jgi:hypothetical protein
MHPGPGGMFSSGALQLEQQVSILSILVSALLEEIHPGVQIDYVDPFSVGIGISAPNPATENGYPRIHASGVDLHNAIEQLKYIRNNIIANHMAKGEIE